MCFSAFSVVHSSTVRFGSFLRATSLTPPTATFGMGLRASSVRNSLRSAFHAASSSARSADSPGAGKQGNGMHNKHGVIRGACPLFLYQSLRGGSCLIWKEGNERGRRKGRRRERGSKCIGRKVCPAPDDINGSRTCVSALLEKDFSRATKMALSLA